MILADSGVVTGLFTLGGVAITLCVTAILELSRRKHEDLRRWNSSLADLYSNFLALAAKFEDANSSALSSKLAAARDRIQLLGSNDVYTRTLSYLMVAEHHADWCRRKADYDPETLAAARREVTEAMQKDLGILQMRRWRALGRWHSQ